MTQVRNKQQKRANRIKHQTASQRTAAFKKLGLVNKLLPGERLYRYFCWDMAACSCDPHDVFSTIPVVNVGITGTWKRLQAFKPDPTCPPPQVRCLRCGVTWPEPLTGVRRPDRILFQPSPES